MTSPSDIVLEPRVSRVARVLHRWEPVLGDQVDAAAPILASAQLRIPGLLQRITVPSKAARGDLENAILPGAALYLELRERVGQDRATTLTAACLSANQERHARVFRLLDRTPWLYLIFRRSGMRTMRSAFSPPAWRVRWVEDTAHRVRFDITRCYFLETLATLGIPELTALYCHGDEVIYGGLDHVRFVRTGTLAQGCDRCDFCFEPRAARPRPDRFRGAQGGASRAEQPDSSPGVLTMTDVVLTFGTVIDASVHTVFEYCRDPTPATRPTRSPKRR